MKILFTCVRLAASLLLPTLATHAQTTFSVGPRLGLNLAGSTTYHDYDAGRDLATGTQFGGELGVVANLGFGHWAVQPALLYAQRGFTVQDTYSSPSSGGTASHTYDDSYRLNYLLLPLNLAYAPHPDGQGVQVLAGPYLGLLLGGTYQYNQRVVRADGSSSNGLTSGGDIGIGSTRTPNNRNDQFFVRSPDFGLQAGLGYHAGPLLLQATYSQSLHDLHSDFVVNYGQGRGTKTFPGPSYKTRSFQLSLAYLFGGSSTK